MELRSDYHLEINIAIPIVDGDNGLRETLVHVWADALEALGIPFFLPLCRFNTFHKGQADEYHQLIYGVAVVGTEPSPAAKALREATEESLANHGLGGRHVGVEVFRIERELMDTSRSAEQVDQFRKGVLAA